MICKVGGKPAQAMPPATFAVSLLTTMSTATAATAVAATT